MKTRINWLVVSTVLATNLIATAAMANAPVVRISPNFQPDPIVVQGTSGGAKNSNCGNIAGAPNQVIQVTKPLPYLQLQVKSEGQPTLLIEGPGGRFCVLADRFSGGSAQISGFWQPGRYSLYIGERSQGRHPYTLSISQKKSP
ncbi:hypothetical protein IQ230_03415 [Gloeocapsopsis crepidinum LEGE 06123]|uniref:Uncharacterized protein n=1 Tax=Gloeocapsopsis crepidinum LEGE 06123 TaxID=588587 RepID=A0ABR9UPY7_9CHRO|nr:hypothetical protein [Gloeocapsopsis crepidinum]MBE9189428.1 hypothetical protein [Gloeocapsopsis crepidinum LEGE 06123]